MTYLCTIIYKSREEGNTIRECVHKKQVDKMFLIRLANYIYSLYEIKS